MNKADHSLNSLCVMVRVEYTSSASTRRIVWLGVYTSPARAAPTIRSRYILLLRTGFCTRTGDEDEKSSRGRTSNNYTLLSSSTFTMIPATKHSPCTTFSFFTRGSALFHSSSCSSLSFYASSPTLATTENSELVSTRCISSAENH